MGKTEIDAYLSHLATERKVSASTQRQALNAIIFLYRHVLDQPIEERIEPTRAKRHPRPPVCQGELNFYPLWELKIYPPSVLIGFHKERGQVFIPDEVSFFSVFFISSSFLSPLEYIVPFITSRRNVIQGSRVGDSKRLSHHRFSLRKKGVKSRKKGVRSSFLTKSVSFLSSSFLQAFSLLLNILFPSLPRDVM